MRSPSGMGWVVWAVGQLGSRSRMAIALNQLVIWLLKKKNWLHALLVAIGRGVGCWVVGVWRKR